MQILVDTNIALRIADPNHAHHASAVSTTEALRRKGHILCVVPQVHYEFWVVGTRPLAQNGLGLTIAEVEAEIDKLGPPLFRFLRDERAIYIPWRDLVVDHSVVGRQAHDARLVAAMVRHNITHLITFNVSDFQRYPEITVIDPNQPKSL